MLNHPLSLSLPRVFSSHSFSESFSSISPTSQGGEGVWGGGPAAFFLPSTRTRDHATTRPRGCTESCSGLPFSLERAPPSPLAPPTTPAATSSTAPYTAIKWDFEQPLGMFLLGEEKMEERGEGMLREGARSGSGSGGGVGGGTFLPSPSPSSFFFLPPQRTMSPLN